MNQPLTKIAVARRQLSTAIELLFGDRDEVSVYSLATNAWEVVDALCTRAGVESMSTQVRENVPTGKDLKRHYVNSPYRNFFKHADNDANVALEPLPPSHIEGLLFLAVEDYIRLNGRSPVQFQVYQLWYLAKHPEKLDPSTAKKLLEGVERAFPGLSSLSRKEQLALGARMLADFGTDQLLIADARTEPAFE